MCYARQRRSLPSQRSVSPSLAHSLLLLTLPSNRRQNPDRDPAHLHRSHHNERLPRLPNRSLRRIHHAHLFRGQRNQRKGRQEDDQCGACSDGAEGAGVRELCGTGAGECGGVSEDDGGEFVCCCCCFCLSWKGLGGRGMGMWWDMSGGG